MDKSYNPFSLEGKTILVTGASSGIGRATAIECSRLGAKLIITGRNEERLNSVYDELAGECHRMIVGDLTYEETLSKLIESLETVDGVVLCAGISVTLPISFSTRRKIDAIFETNFFSQIELLRLLQKKKKLSNGASIVGISSIGGNSTFTPGSAAYGASKAAFRSVLKTAAKEMAPRVRVNCILPGQVNTPMVNTGTLSDEQYEAYKQTVPMRRFAETRDVALGAVYLLSDASSYITGSDLKIDGGVTL